MHKGVTLSSGSTVRTGMMRSFLLNVYNLGNEVGFGGSKHVHVDKVVEDIPVR